jgi:hypothetical protein
MNRLRVLLMLAGAVVVAPPAQAQGVAAGAKANPAVADVSKGVHIEKSTEGMVAKRSASVSGETGFTNPRVEPGKVKWHDSFAAACARARTTGRPVLLFQMMGKLDDQFC